MTVIDRRYSVAEGTAIKAPCRVATTANITLSGLQTIDGVTVVEHDRVLVRTQTTGSENGIYEASSGNWQRTKDFDGSYDVVKGTRVYVTSGTSYAGTEFTVATSDPITIGTTSISFSGANLASTGGIRVFNTYADMIAATFSSGDYVSLLGYYSPGDGGGGNFFWDEASSTTANIGTVVRPTAYASSAGRLFRVFDGSNIYPRWFGAKIDGSTDDTAVIQSAFDALQAYQRLVFTPGRYKTNGCISCTTSNISVHFDDVTFKMGDTGTDGTMSNGAYGKIGFLFKDAANLTISGAVRMIGQGTIGATSLAGMVFDTCLNALVPATMYFERMAAGRFMQWCDRGRFGHVMGKDMNGLQTFEDPPTTSAGSLEVFVGCRYSTFGDAVGYDNYKPVRYLSVAYDRDNVAVDTDLCTFGSTVGESSTSDLESCVLAVRSGTRCTFGPVSSVKMGQGVLFVQYSTDADFRIGDNIIVSVTGDYPSTARSLDAAVSQYTESTVPIGSNTVLSLKVTAGGEDAVFCSNGKLSIRDAEISGSTNPVWGQECILYFGRLIIENAARECIVIGNNCAFSADFIEIRSGSSLSGTSFAIKYNASAGSGSLSQVNIGAISYNLNATGNDYLYVVGDTTNGFQNWRIGHIFGAASSGQVVFAGDAFKIDNSRMFAAATPAGGSYEVGAAIWKTTVTAGGSPGWICTTAGTPGTWKAMASVAL